MKNTFTLQEQLEILIEAKKEYLNDIEESKENNSFPGGMCYYLHNIAYEVNPNGFFEYCDILQAFPTLLKYKPNKLYGENKLFWWKRTNTKKRIECFNKAIKELEELIKSI